MKTLKTMMMAMAMTMMVTTAMANTNVRPSEKNKQPQRPQVEQPAPPPASSFGAQQGPRPSCPPPADVKNKKCPVCNKKKCKIHNFCPTCGHPLHNQPQHFGNRNNTFGGNR